MLLLVMALPVVLILDSSCKNLIVHHEIVVVDEKSVTIVVAEHLELLQVRRLCGSCLRRSCIRLIGESVGIEPISTQCTRALSAHGFHSVNNVSSTDSTGSKKHSQGSDVLPLDELFKVHANLFGSLIPDLGDLSCWLEGSISWHGSRGLCRGARGVGQTGGVHPGGQVMLRVDKVG